MQLIKLFSYSYIRFYVRKQKIQNIADIMQTHYSNPRTSCNRATELAVILLIIINHFIQKYTN